MRKIFRWSLLYRKTEMYQQSLSLKGTHSGVKPAMSEVVKKEVRTAVKPKRSEREKPSDGGNQTLRKKRAGENHTTWGVEWKARPGETFLGVRTGPHSFLTIEEKLTSPDKRNEGVK